MSDSKITKPDVLLWIGQAVDGLCTRFRGGGCGNLNGCATTKEIYAHFGDFNSDMHNLRSARDYQNEKLEQFRKEISVVKEFAVNTLGLATSANKRSEKTEDRFNAIWIQILFGVILGNSVIVGVIFYIVRELK